MMPLNVLRTSSIEVASMTAFCISIRLSKKLDCTSYNRVPIRNATKARMWDTTSRAKMKTITYDHKGVTFRERSEDENVTLRTMEADDSETITFRTSAREFH